jgi:hypothetical protein
MTSPQLSLGLVFRLGVPLAANVDGHATAAPGIMARARYRLSPSGEGLMLMGEVGYGVLRSTLNLDNAMPGQNVDIVASGPLLLGGGAGYTKKLSSSVIFLADFSLLAGLAVGCSVDPMTMLCTLGSPIPSTAVNSGFTIDLSLGLALGL